MGWGEFNMLIGSADDNTVASKQANMLSKPLCRNYNRHSPPLLLHYWKLIAVFTGGIKELMLGGYI